LLVGETSETADNRKRLDVARARWIDALPACRFPGSNVVGIFSAT